VSEAPVSVLIVDDHPVVRQGLAGVLREHPRITVEGEAATVEESVTEAERLRPDVVIMDLRLPDGNGVEACRDIRSGNPAAKVLILTSHRDKTALRAAIVAGASGYVLKDIDPTAVQTAVLTIADGGSLLDPQLVDDVVKGLRQRRGEPDADGTSPLTLQEERILDFIGGGLTNREIAGELSISEMTVKNYVSVIYSKLHVEGRAQAAREATERRMRRERE
jgi:DNA-binding NarL/FixJ family response regulator